MSAGFCNSYYDILKRNVRHIYSGQPPSEIRFRVNQYHDGIDVIDRIHWLNQTRPKSRNEILREYEFMENYGMFIPRAPAFEKLPKSRVSNVVERLYSRKIQEQRQLLRQYARRPTRSAPAKQGAKSKGNGKLRTQSDVNEIVTRLYRSHTFCTTTKMRDKTTEVTPTKTDEKRKTADDTDDHVIKQVDSHNARKEAISRPTKSKKPTDSVRVSGI